MLQNALTFAVSGKYMQVQRDIPTSIHMAQNKTMQAAAETNDSDDYAFAIQTDMPLLAYSTERGNNSKRRMCCTPCLAAQHSKDLHGKTLLSQADSPPLSFCITHQTVRHQQHAALSNQVTS